MLQIQLLQGTRFFFLLIIFVVDHCFFRWKKDANGTIMLHSFSNKPILQFVSILRSDVKEWAIPGVGNQS